MAAHGIDVYDFEHWIGPAPEFAQPQVENHTRPGTWGTYQVQTGVKGRQFERELRHVFSTYLEAQAALAFWNTLVGVGPLQLKYNNVNYAGIYGHLYSVDRIIEPDAYALNGALGPTYYYPFGGVAKMRIVLTPHPIL